MSREPRTEAEEILAAVEARLLKKTLWGGDEQLWAINQQLYLMFQDPFKQLGEARQSLQMGVGNGGAETWALMPPELGRELTWIYGGGRKANGKQKGFWAAWDEVDMEYRFYRTVINDNLRFLRKIKRKPEDRPDDVINKLLQKIHKTIIAEGKYSDEERALGGKLREWSRIAPKVTMEDANGGAVGTRGMDQTGTPGTKGWGKMTNIEAQAQKSLNVLSPFNKDILTNALFRDAVSDEFGNLEDACLGCENQLENALSRVLRADKADRMDPGDPLKQAECRNARAGLNATLTEFDKLWTREVLPRLKKDAEAAVQKAQKDEVKVTNKTDFVDQVNKATGMIGKILASGKKVWELVKEHEGMFAAIGKAVALLVP